MDKLTRQIERVKKKLLVKVDNNTCVMEDFSLFGMRVVCPVLIKKTDVDIQFMVDETSLVLKGHISWIKKFENVYNQPQYRVGIYIPVPPDEYIQVASQWVNE